jgi:hypothetical protein
MVVERDGPSRTTFCANDAIVPHGQRDERRNRQRGHPDGSSELKDEESGQRNRGNRGQAQISKARVEAGETRML